METTIAYLGYIGIMEKKMETPIVLYHDETTCLDLMVFAASRHSACSWPLLHSHTYRYLISAPLYWGYIGVILV